MQNVLTSRLCGRRKRSTVGGEGRAVQMRIRGDRGPAAEDDLADKCAANLRLIVRSKIDGVSNAR